MKQPVRSSATPLYPILKEFIDRIAAAVLLVLFSPVLLVTSLLLLVGPQKRILFRQVRAGKHGTSFTLFKFKTMRDSRNNQGCLLPDKERITRLGQFLRASSIDELPQLVNVIRGEMSLVGPRPLYPEYTPLYSSRQALRLSVKPGITGLAQINGRNHTTWPERLEWDARYVERMGFLLDLKILARTVISVFFDKNVHAGEEMTMRPFTGNRPPSNSD